MESITVDVWLDERIVAELKRRFDGDVSKGVNLVLAEHFSKCLGVKIPRRLSRMLEETNETKASHS